MMRDLTQLEIDYVFHTGRCPLCGSLELYESGVGGMSQNIWCDSCNGGINLMGPRNVNLGGQVIREPKEGTIPPDHLPPRKFLLPGGFIGSLCAWFSWLHPKIEER